MIGIFHYVGSQDLALLALTSLVFVFIIYVVSPQLLLGLIGGLGAWHASRMRDIETGNSGRKMRKVKVYIKRMHKGQCPEPIQGAGLETRLHAMDTFLSNFNAFLHKLEQEQRSRTMHNGTQTTRLDDCRASVIRSNEYINMQQQNRSSSERSPDVVPMSMNL